jgi:hypothetical protein
MSTTIVLARAEDSYNPSVIRCPPWARPLARLRSYDLDTRLARGESPDSNMLLSLRAQQLQRAAGRRRVARGFRRLLSTARRTPHPFDRRVPVAGAEICECQGLIEELIALLESGVPVDPACIARAHLLICEGSSPLYRPAVTGALEPALHAVIGSIEPPEVYALA